MLRYLAEAGLLGRTEVISAVSGGSILAAVLADRWPHLAAGGFTAEAFVGHVEQPVRGALAELNLRNRGLRRWLVRRATIRGPARGAMVLRTIIEHLCETEAVVELDPGLQALITSTDLASGYAFRISQGFVGNYTYGYAPTGPELRLWEAVAASAAVPGLFTPLQLASAHLGLTDGPRTLSLTDGGVYDNLALEWFQGWDASRRPAVARPVDFLIVVDSSGDIPRHPGSYHSLRALLRTRDLQYWMTRATRVRWLVDQLSSGSLRGVLVGIRADPRTTRMPDGTPYPPMTYEGALPSSLVAPLASIRTDLDRFSLDESGALAYHGYWLCHARLANLYPALALPAPDWRGYANLSPSEQTALLARLPDGARLRARRPRRARIVTDHQ